MKGRYRIVLLAVMIAAAAPLASDASDDYEKLIFHKKDRRLYVNTRTLAYPAERVVSLWDKVVPRKGSRYHRRIQRVVRNAGKEYRELEYFQTLTEIDCERNIHRDVQTLYYDENNRIVLAEDSPDSHWHEIRPGQKEAILSEEICSNLYASLESMEQVLLSTSMGCPEIR
jgi:hypothetical protein